MPDLSVAARYARATVVGWQVFLGAWALLGGALVLSGFVVESRGWPGAPFFVCGLMLLVVFGALFVMARGRFADPAPVITITAQAFHDRRLGDPIPWTEVRSLARHKPGNRIFLQIGVDDPGRWLTAAGLMARPMQVLNPRMGFTALASRLDGLDVPQDRLAEAAETGFAASR